MKYVLVIAFLSLLFFGVAGHLLLEEGDGWLFKSGDETIERFLERAYD